MSVWLLYRPPGKRDLRAVRVDDVGHGQREMARLLMLNSDRFAAVGIAGRGQGKMVERAFRTGR